MHFLEIRDLSFNYPDKKILNNIDFNVDKGDFICIVGTNGTGKTTLMKLILNLLKPQKGTILIKGTKSTDFKEFEKISYVSQNATSFNQSFPATVKEIVELGLYGKKLSKSEKEEKINSALETVGMCEYKNKLIGNLSGGQKQRVFIAKAIVKNPELLLLDEPTVGIDNEAVNSICCLLGRLNKSGITILMVTHDLSSVLLHSNKVLTLCQEGCCKMYTSEQYSENTIKSYFHHHKEEE